MLLSGLEYCTPVCGLFECKIIISNRNSNKAVKANTSYTFIFFFISEGIKELGRTSHSVGSIYSSVCSQFTKRPEHLCLLNKLSQLVLVRVIT